MKKVLLKDIVIKAGTIFNTAPSKIELCDNGHVSHIFGLTNNTYGEILYHFDDSAPEDEKKLEEWFADVNE